ncbi:MAG: ABC transporter substrate-binding protein [Deltaproteobacteria bacterium]|nr:ABC transporter substrate-binding protein [Deltaproteobacteria bacterium]
MKRTLISFLAFLLILPCAAWAADVIKIGLNIELTGDIPEVGEFSKNVAKLFETKINAAGGWDVGGKKYKIQFIIEDNESKAESAVTVATKLITSDNVLVMVGPQASKQAIAAGEVANNLKTPMISPWSTNPATTLNRPYVFRGCFLDDFQCKVIAKFVTEEYKAKKAAVLYDIASDAPKGQAEFFKKAFESIHGPGSVTAFETFTTKDVDFSAQLTKIVKSGADILFTPQYYNEVPLIINQAKQLGWTKPIVGSDAWAGGDLMGMCGKDCNGYFFTCHSVSKGAKGITKEFVDSYNAAYHKNPDSVAALTWDSLNIVLAAIQKTGGLTGDLKKDRQAVTDQIGKLKDFPGVTGAFTYMPGGNPSKCVPITKIDAKEGFVFYKTVCP